MPVMTDWFTAYCKSTAVKKSVDFFSMGIVVIPIPVYVHSHSSFPFPSWSLTAIPIGNPIPSDYYLQLTDEDAVEGGVDADELEREDDSDETRE